VGNDPAEQAAVDVTRLLAAAHGLRRVVEVARQACAPPRLADGEDFEALGPVWLRPVS
jgi:hypothetical protein